MSLFAPVFVASSRFTGTGETSAFSPACRDGSFCRWQDSRSAVLVLFFCRLGVWPLVGHFRVAAGHSPGRAEASRSRCVVGGKDLGLCAALVRSPLLLSGCPSRHTLLCGLAAPLLAPPLWPGLLPPGHLLGPLHEACCGSLALAARWPSADARFQTRPMRWSPLSLHTRTRWPDRCRAVVRRGCAIER